MIDIDLDKVFQILSALVLGGVVGWFVSHLIRVKFPTSVLITLAWIGFFIFVIW